MNANIIKKISVATVHGKIDRKTLTKEGTVLFRAIGCATGIKSGQSTYGDWTALLGDFAAIKPDGEVIRATQIFLPDVVLNMIQPKVEAGDAVEFALDIVAIEDANSQTGYTYAARPVIAPDAATDPVTRLVQQIEKQALLSAPEKTGETSEEKPAQSNGKKK